MIGRRPRPPAPRAAAGHATSLILAALVLAAMLPARQQVPKPLFDGVTLAGWEGDPTVWKACDGVIAGSTRGLPAALIWRGGPVGDFELSFEFAVEGEGDAAVRYRCRRSEGDGAPRGGYECGLHRRSEFFGRLYERDGRGIIARRGERIATHRDNVRPRVTGSLAESRPLERGRWHRVRIVARGSTIVHEIDGAVAVEVDDRWKKAPRAGWLALELRGDGPTAVAFRDLRLRRRLAAQPFPDASSSLLARRIWCADGQEQQELWLRRRVLLRTPVASAPLTVSCDNECRVYVNGALVLAADDWQQPPSIDVAAHLRIGDNVIAVYAVNTGGPGALALWLPWSDPAGGGGAATSDAAWRYTDELRQGWERPRFDDRAWNPVHVLDGEAALGQTVWGTPVAK